MTVTEFKNKYTEIGALLLAWNIKDVAYFSLIPMADITAEIWEMLTTKQEVNGETRFRYFKKKNLNLLKKYVVEVGKTADVESQDEKGMGFKTEKYLFGKADHSPSLIDGIYHGIPVQVKSSFKLVATSGYSNSGPF